MQQLGNMKEMFDDLSDPEQFACLVGARYFLSEVVCKVISRIGRPFIPRRVLGVCLFVLSVLSNL